MIQKADPSGPPAGSPSGSPTGEASATGERSDGGADRQANGLTAFGVDVGATFVKLARRAPGRPVELRLFEASALDEVAREIDGGSPARVGITGGGAPRLPVPPEMDTARVNEFEAWGRGAEVLLREHGAPVPGRYLLVSVGTGTSAMLVESGTARRVGGTALGGGTLLGLGAALAGAHGFEALSELARRGDRRRIDLLVKDIDPSGEFPLPGELNASSFAKLARGAAGEATPADLAHAVVGLVGENVGLLCAWMANAVDAKHVVFGGTTLRRNEPLREILRLVGLAHGRETVFLADGEFTGALGALELASAGGTESELGA